MTIRTLVAYLFGSHDAILQIARCRGALVVGLLFVFSAALAREYDRRYLVAEWSHLFLPLGASILSSLATFTLVYGVARAKGPQTASFARAYLAFLGLWWMTAPLAWLYAIPVERFLSEVDAARANVSLLGVVALWRVILMIRVVSVVFGCHVLVAAALILFVADVVMLVAISYSPVPILAIMSGVASGAESVVSSAGLIAFIFGMLTFLVWLFAAFTAALVSHVAWQVPLHDSDLGQRASWSLYALAVAAILAWLPILRHTQPEQQLGYEANELIEREEYRQAIDLLSEYSPEDLPPQWHPQLPHPSLVAGAGLYESALDSNAPAWLVAVCDDLLRRGATGYYYGWLEQEEFDRVLAAIKRLPDSEQLVESMERDRPRSRDDPSEEEP